VLQEEEEEDTQGIAEAGAYVESLVAAELDKGIPAHRIALVGFSMGGASVLYAALQVRICKRVHIYIYIDIYRYIYVHIYTCVPHM